MEELFVNTTIFIFNRLLLITKLNAFLRLDVTQFCILIAVFTP